VRTLGRDIQYLLITRHLYPVESPEVTLFNRFSRVNYDMEYPFVDPDVSGEAVF